MVYQIRKIRGKELFSVKNVETGKIHSHATTKANAKKQVKLLQAIDHGFVPSKDDLEGGYLGETLVNLYNRIRGHRGAQVAPAPTDDPTNNPNPMGPLAPVHRNGNQVVPEPTMSAQDAFRQIVSGNQVVPYTEQQIYDAFGIPRRSGSGRMNPAVQTMLTYLKSLYPHKTLMSVANEILKLTGHTMSGKGRKPIKATEIAKYVIGAIGAALAIALALFLLNNEIEKGKENDYKNAVNQMEIDRQRRINIEAENKKREEINRKQVEDSRKRAADQILNDLQKERDLTDRINKQREYEQRASTNDYRSIVDPSKKQGGTRLSSAAKSMITYLKSLYPHKTLVSVANEILKITGHKMTGKGRKSTTASSIAKYVIGAIGTALAIAVAIFLLSDEDKGISQSNIHPRLDKSGPEQIDRYPYTPNYTPTTTSSSQKPDISLESLYGDVSPSYTNMMNPGFKKVGIPKKKSEDKYLEYPRSSETFSGNPKGYGRKRRSSAADAKGIRLKKKKKVM